MTRKNSVFWTVVLQFTFFFSSTAHSGCLLNLERANGYLTSRLERDDHSRKLASSPSTHQPATNTSPINTNSNKSFVLAALLNEEHDAGVFVKREILDPPMKDDARSNLEKLYFYQNHFLGKDNGTEKNRATVIRENLQGNFGIQPSEVAAQVQNWMLQRFDRLINSMSRDSIRSEHLAEIESTGTAFYEDLHALEAGGEATAALVNKYQTEMANAKKEKFIAVFNFRARAKLSAEQLSVFENYLSTNPHTDAESLAIAYRESRNVASNHEGRFDDKSLAELAVLKHSSQKSSEEIEGLIKAWEISIRDFENNHPNASRLRNSDLVAMLRLSLSGENPNLLRTQRAFAAVYTSRDRSDENSFSAASAELQSMLLAGQWPEDQAFDHKLGQAANIPIPPPQSSPFIVAIQNPIPLIVPVTPPPMNFVPTPRLSAGSLESPPISISPRVAPSVLTPLVRPRETTLWDLSPSNPP